jgi:hypothetical protein
MNLNVGIGMNQSVGIGMNSNVGIGCRVGTNVGSEQMSGRNKCRVGTNVRIGMNLNVGIGMNQSVGIKNAIFDRKSWSSSIAIHQLTLVKAAERTIRLRKQSKTQ